MWDDKVWDRVDAAVERLKHAWQSGTEVEMGQLLPTPEDPCRKPVLVTLIKIDQERRWRMQERLPLEDYLRLWPELEGDSQAILELLNAECRIRRDFDRLPTYTELEARFPTIASQLDLVTIAAEGQPEDRGHRLPPIPSELVTSFMIGRCENTERSGQHPLKLGDRISRYEVQAVLGQGGMGIVYLANDADLGRLVAIKVLHPWAFSLSDQCDLVLQGDRTAAKLNHRAIVAIYDSGKLDDGSPFFVMEYVAGRSLAERLASGPLGQDVAATVAMQIADALQTAHQQGFVHRDIKPANILIDAEGQAHLTDFGLALHESVRNRTSGELSGTLPYMAPEQIKGDVRILDGRADIWALGAVLYEMLTGRRPFERDTPEALAEAILHHDPKPLRQIAPTLSNKLASVCLKCLSKDVSDRYQAAVDVARDLQGWKESTSRRQWWRLVTILLAGSLLCIAAVTFMAFGRTSRIAPPDARRDDGTAITAGRRKPEPREPEIGSRNPMGLCPWLEPCKLVLAADTNARIDLLIAMEFVRGHSEEMLSPGLLGYDNSRAAIVNATARIRDNWMCWEMPLCICWPEIANDSQLGPSTVSLRVRAAIDRHGTLQVGTIARTPEEHLLVLTQRGGIENYRPLSGRGVLSARQFGEPHNAVLDTDEKQTLLTQWLADIYRAFRSVPGLCQGGPTNGAELYACSMKMHNLFEQSVVVVHGRIHHQQFDYAHYPEDFRFCEQAMNNAWSPVAEQPDQDVTLGLAVDLKCSEDASSALYLASSTDNMNSSSFKAFGLTVDRPPPHRTQGRTAFVRVDKDKGVCEGGNESSSGAQAILYNQSPSRIELSAFSHWSVVQPFFRYATLGKVEVLKTTTTPATPPGRPIQPHVWVIPVTIAQTQTTTAPPSGTAATESECTSSAPKTRASSNEPMRCLPRPTRWCKSGTMPRA